MNTPLISIIVPTFNRADLISESIESALNQTYTNIELLVIDDGSTDDTERIVKEYSTKDSKIKYIKRPANRTKGANTCRNIGWENSQGQYIKWLDSDDILEPNCLDKQVQILNTRPANVVFCKTGYFKDTGNNKIILDKLWSKKITSNQLSRDLVFGELRWHTMSGLWQKDNFKAGPFIEGLMNSQEWLFHIQESLKENTWKIGYVDEVLCYARVHTGSMSDKGNKKGKYYYNEAYARWLAMQLLWKHRPVGYQKMIRFLLNKFAWFHFYSLYKKGYRPFLLLFQYYPKMIYYSI